jgi:hypothetical protein
MRKHALTLNLMRRHLGPISWAEGFKKLAEVRGMRLGSGKGDPSGRAATVAALAEEVGVPDRTAQYRMKLAEVRGVRLGSGKGDPGGKTATVAALAEEVGVPARTARYRMHLDECAGVA